jgi:hypothetical protein
VVYRFSTPEAGTFLQMSVLVCQDDLDLLNSFLVGASGPPDTSIVILVLLVTPQHDNGDCSPGISQVILPSEMTSAVVGGRQHFLDMCTYNFTPALELLCIQGLEHQIDKTILVDLGVTYSSQ